MWPNCNKAIPLNAYYQLFENFVWYDISLKEIGIIEDKLKIEWILKYEDNIKRDTTAK